MVGGRCFIVCRRSAAAGLGLSGARPPAARSHHPASRAEAHSRASPEPLPTPWSRSRIQGGRDGNGPRSGLELFSALKGSDFPEGRGGGEGHRVGGGGAAGTGERSDAVGTGVRPGGLRSPGALGELGGGSTPRFPRPPSPIGHPHGPSQTSARCG